MIELKSLSKTFGNVKAVSDISLDVADGSFTSFIGPSGSGKSTLLSMIAGFDQPTSGTIRLHGKDVSKLPSSERNIGMVFQNYALFPHLSVFENVAFPLRVRNMDARTLTSRVHEALESVGLKGFEARWPKQLSGGQQQRVALARAFVFGPEVLLMDEPLGALDKNLREHMQSEIKALQRRLAVSVIYVTHDQGEALAMSDNVVVMSDGRIQQVGAPAEVYRRPQSKFVAQFLGETNLLEYDLVSRGLSGPIGRLANGAAFVLPDNITDAASGTLSLRPEEIEFADPAESGCRHARIEETVFLGDCMRCRVDYQGLPLWVKLPATVMRSVPRVGQNVALHWNEASLVPLDD
ncbi:hypothetical protein ABB55_14410 [Prosthecomicrobium hirschii]|uniref:ABC transporter domain-containing protein n=1 Tax=Prosthecodimorpha hirschii TaxID=665126 RepID=A0A0N8GF40_9HYPH|nr:ABC transporter ATP-binding protein [Prosthecomicrobium hirschii]KPL53257.1 hypothetical protein ABB55_14410 [Prosthecomicrobium hirschii]